MNPEEAVDIFRKWTSEQTEVFVFSRLYGWAFNSFCRVIAEPTLAEVVLKAGDSAWFTFNLGVSDLICEYKEPRSLEATHPELAAELSPEIRELSFLTVSLPLRVVPDSSEPPLRELVFFFEMPRALDTNPLAR